MRKAKPAKAKSTKAKAAKAKATHAANLQKENKTVSKLQQSLQVRLFSDAQSRKLPYAGSGRDFSADAIWVAPEGSRYKGVCIELQGVGKHTRLTGVMTDNIKAAIAQNNGWLVWASTYPGIKQMFPLLVDMISTASGKPADENGELPPLTHADV